MNEEMEKQCENAGVAFITHLPSLEAMKEGWMGQCFLFVAFFVFICYVFLFELISIELFFVGPFFPFFRFFFVILVSVILLLGSFRVYFSGFPFVVPFAFFFYVSLI